MLNLMLLKHDGAGGHTGEVLVIVEDDPDVQFLFREVRTGIRRLQRFPPTTVTTQDFVSRRSALLAALSTSGDSALEQSQRTRARGTARLMVRASDTRRLA
jgi:hypothetical protein